MKIKLRKEKYTITYRTGDIGSSMACECRSDDEARKLAREFLNCCDVVTLTRHHAGYDADVPLDDGAYGSSRSPGFI